MDSAQPMKVHENAGPGRCAGCGELLQGMVMREAGRPMAEHAACYGRRMQAERDRHAANQTATQDALEREMERTQRLADALRTVLPFLSDSQAVVVREALRCI